MFVFSLITIPIFLPSGPLRGRVGKFASLLLSLWVKQTKWNVLNHHSLQYFSFSTHLLWLPFGLLTFCTPCACFTPHSHTFSLRNMHPGNTAAKWHSISPSFPPSFPLFTSHHSLCWPVSLPVCLSPPTASYTLYSVSVYNGWRMFSQTEYQSISLWRDIILK